MKNITNIMIGLALGLVATSCSMDTELTQYKDAESAFSTLDDLSNAVNGSYYNMGRSGFLGRNAIAFGDISAGVCKGSEAKGWFAAIGQYNITEYESEFENCWAYGYKVIDQTTRTIKGGKEVKTGDTETLNQYMGESYGLRALSNWYLVNLFGLPYHTNASSNMGLVLVEDEPIEAFQEVKRATVAQTYELILRDLAKAESLLKAGDRGAFYMNYGAVQALYARTYMDMGKYTEAEAAAKAALTWLGNGTATASDDKVSNDDYLAMWTNSGGSSVVQSPEDIFSIKKATDDNLGASSLNTLYGSYENVLSLWVPGIFDATDIRAKLIESLACGNQPMKFRGLSNNAAVANIPIFRKSEMALIIAECEARAGNIAASQDYLMYTAKRNTAYADGTKKLPDTKDGILSFLNDERVREFFQEGHAFYDARRLGNLVNSNYYKNFDVQKFCFPIPEAEVNSNSGVEQNPNWSDALPKK